MPDDLQFMMGKYAARIPGDRLYTESHLWLKPHAGVFQAGFTAYSVRLLQDVYFLTWSIDAQTRVKKKQEIGEIESSKAVSTLYSPCAGVVQEFNERLLQDPSAINVDNYEQGWLFTMQTDEELLSPEAYLEVLAAGWEATQRIIKGQLND